MISKDKASAEGEFWRGFLGGFWGFLFFFGGKKQEWGSQTGA